MTFPPAFECSRIVIVQSAMVLLVLLAVAVWPPARGRLLLVPLSDHAGRTMIAALASRGSIVAVGPVAGSVVVVNDRPGLRWSMLAHGVVPLAATGGCGTFAGKPA